MPTSRGEIISYTGKNPATSEFTGCRRGAERTTAASHPDNTIVAYSTTTPAATSVQVHADLNTVAERFTQCGIRLKPIDIDLGGVGRVLPSALLNGYWYTRRALGGGGIQPVPTESENFIAALKDSDANSIDIFYVDLLFCRDDLPTLTHHRGTAYRAEEHNKTGDRRFENFTVLSRMRGVLTMAHELMHILLNADHPIVSSYPSTALFHSPTVDDKRVDSTKRIGPYPDTAAKGVGDDDTRIMRSKLTWLTK